MARSTCALVLLASSTALGHVFPRQSAFGNTTAVDTGTEPPKEPRGSRPIFEQPATTLDTSTQTAHTEQQATSLDSPAGSPSRETVSTSWLSKTAHVEKTQTSFDRPPVPTDDNISTQWTVHTEKTQATLDVPGTISWMTWDTSIHITLSMPRTEISQATLDTPGATSVSAPKAVVDKPASTLDVPSGPPTTINQPGTAVSIAKPGQNNDVPNPGGASEKPDDEDGQSSPTENEGRPGNGRPGGNEGAQVTPTQNAARPTAGGVGGLISAIQSVSTKQAAAVQNGQEDNPNRPVGVVTAAESGSRPSVIGFAIGTQTASPGGAAFTRGGSTFSALPSGAGLQVVANGHTSIIPFSESATSTTIQTGNSQDEYVFGTNTLTAGGDPLVSAGTTFSALPSGSGIAIIIKGTTSTGSIGEVKHMDINTSKTDSALATPVLLPANPQQLITIGAKTYTAHLTAGSLLVLGSQTIRPGFTTVIDGETLLLTGSNLVLATGTSTSTRGLGGSITSSIGDDGESEGKENASTTSGRSESSAATATAADTGESTSGAEQRSLSGMYGLLGGFVSLVFALVLM